MKIANIMIGTLSLIIGILTYLEIEYKWPFNFNYGFLEGEEQNQDSKVENSHQTITNRETGPKLMIEEGTITIPLQTENTASNELNAVMEPSAQISHQTTNLSLTMLMNTSKEFIYDSEKLNYIVTHIQSVPDKLSLAELNDILAILIFPVTRLKVAKLLRPKLDNANYFLDQDIKRFLDLFWLDKYRSVALGLIFTL